MRIVDSLTSDVEIVALNFGTNELAAHFYSSHASRAESTGACECIRSSRKSHENVIGSTETSIKLENVCNKLRSAREHKENMIELFRTLSRTG